jgi:anti-anti-sigma factor
VEGRQVEPAGRGRLVIRSEVDIANAHEFEEVLLLHAGNAAPDLTLDLAALLYMDSVAVRTLLLAARSLSKRGGKLVLEAPQPLVRRVLEVLRVDELPNVEVAG